MKLVDVLVCRGVGQTYSYQCEDTTIQIGDHVEVPFGRSAATGIIMKPALINDDDTLSFKKVGPKINSLPQLNPELIQLIHWFSDTYHCTPFKAYQTIIGKKKLRDINPADFTAKMSPSPFSLTEEQQRSIQHIQSIAGYGCHLLHGVTGSGKTELYLRCAADALSKNSSAIILCPEISLTPQYLNHFKERFGNIVCCLHSGLTPKQRDIEYTKIMTLPAVVVIGPRSSIFAPVQTCNCIIIDEEHDLSYKQDQHPRYATETIAHWRAKYHDCPLILGSATPSLESYYAATTLRQKNYSYSQINQRISGHPLPAINIIDMAELKDQGIFDILSPKLITAIKTTITENQKVILLLNRRGYAPMIACQYCGEIHTCEECNLSYTYHQDKQFHCHRCNIKKPVSHTCKKCNKNGLSFSGIGTQKVEIELNRHFHNKTIIRLDKDTAKTANSMAKLLTQFKEEGDILVGTQLIAKGHHIEDVALVGVCGIDTTLNMPDYRSSEHAFQLILQVAGRAGRGKKAGTVLLQTYQPHHYVFDYAKTNDYAGFVNHELNFRDSLFYPPYSAMVHCIISSPIKQYAQKFAAVIAHHFKQHVDIANQMIKVLGPKPAPIEKVRNYYRFSVICKFSQDERPHVMSVLRNCPPPPNIGCCGDCCINGCC